MAAHVGRRPRWNATDVEFEVRSNVGITDETIPTNMRGGSLTSGSPTTDVTSITTTPYTFTFNNTDRAEAQRDFTLLFVPAEPSELTLPVTFSQRGQSWSRGNDPAPLGHTGTGAGAGSFTPLAVTSNIRWQATSSAPTWLTLSLETTGFGTTVARNDRVTTPVLDPADLTKNGPMNIHVDAITELNPAMTDDRRTGTISFTNLDSADGGIALSTEAITITQWAPVLRPKSTTLPTESQQKLPAAATSYTISATTNLQGWGVRIYSTTSNMGGATERTPLVAETFGSTPTIDPAAVPLAAGRSLSITIPQYYGFDDRELEFVLWCSGFAGEVPIVSRTQGASSSLRLSPDLVAPFDAADGSSASREITVTANVDWTAELVGTNSNDFLLSAESGSGSGSFTVSPKTANESTVARTATIRVTGTGLTPVERAIAQNGAGASITLDPTEWTFLAAQGTETTQTIEVRANVDWTATLLTGGDYFEIVTGTGTGAAGTGSFTIRPKAANKMPTLRTATISVTGTGASKTFTARHAAAEPSIIVLPDTPLAQFLATDGTATTRTVSVTANIPWTATLEGTGAAAFELSQTSGTGTGTEITFTVSPKKANNTVDQLDATIVVSGTGEHTALSDQVAVSQAATTPRLNVTTTSVTWTATQNGVAKPIVIDANIPWTATLSGMNANTNFELNRDSGGPDDELTISTLSDNEDPLNDRTAQVIIAAANTTAYPTLGGEVDLTHYKSAPELSILPASHTFAANGAGQTFTVTSNFEWDIDEVTGTHSADFTVTKTNATTLTVTPKTDNLRGDITRKAKITLAGPGDLSTTTAELALTQSAASPVVLMVSVSSLPEFAYDATSTDTNTFTVTANVAWTGSVTASKGFTISPTASTTETSGAITSPQTITVTPSPNGIAAREATVSIVGTTAGGTKTVGLTQGGQPVVGGFADIIYLDANGNLAVGKWGAGNPVNSTNIVYFQFGSVIGFDLATSAFSRANVIFNTTATDYNTYSYIPCYNAWAGSMDASPMVSDPAYHNATNLSIGRGDPCMLVGFDISTLDGKTATERGEMLAAHNSGWRMPTAREQLAFIGYPDAENLPTANLPTNSLPETMYPYRVTENTIPRRPTVSIGEERNGGMVPILTWGTNSGVNSDGEFMPDVGGRTTTGGLDGRSDAPNYWPSNQLYADDRPFCIGLGEYAIYFTETFLTRRRGNPIRCVSISQ